MIDEQRLLVRLMLRECDRLVNESNNYEENVNIKCDNFIVVSPSYENGEGVEQLSIPLETYSKAKDFMDGVFIKRNYPDAFIVATVNEQETAKNTNIPTADTWSVNNLTDDDFNRLLDEFQQYLGK